MILNVAKGIFCLKLRVSVKVNPNRVEFDSTIRSCGTTDNFLMSLLFLVHCVSAGLYLGQHDASNARMMFYLRDNTYKILLVQEIIS